MRLAFLFCVLAALVGGCKDAAAPHPQGIASPHHSVTTLQWGIVGLSDVPTLDPALASDTTSISVASLVYGGLVRLDSRLKVVPDGASSWTISRDGKTYTFTIRKNLRFADGRPVLARDFANGLNRALGPEGASGAAPFYLGLITHGSAQSSASARGISVLGLRRLRITLQRPAAHFLAELAFPAAYVPDSRVMRDYGATWTDHAAGFGPYSVGSWSHTRLLTLNRNPHYYGGKPAFKHIQLRFYDDVSSAESAYRSGQVDVVSGLPPGQPLGSGVEGRRAVAAMALDYLAFNTARFPFHHLNARRAFAAAAQTVLKSGASGNGTFAVHGFVPSGLRLKVPPWKPTLAPRRYLSLSHYSSRSFPSVVLIVPRDRTVMSVALRLRQIWAAKLGIEVTVRQLNASNYSRVLGAHAFDLAIVRWGADYADPQDFLSTQLGSSPNNLTGWSTLRYDRTVALADSYAPTDPRRALLFTGAASIAARKLPILPLDEPAQSAIIRPSLRGIQITPLGTISGAWTQASIAG